jgi:hypothetical protein
MSTIEKVRQEIERLGYPVSFSELPHSREGIILDVETLAGHPEILKITEIGPGGRLSALYDAPDVLHLLEGLEETPDWYPQLLAELEQVQPSPPIRFLSPDGEVLVDAFPLFATH